MNHSIHDALANRPLEKPKLTADDLLRKARAATYNDSHKEATDYWLLLDEQASHGNLPYEWQHHL